jgi:hypothetical protein
MNDLKIVDDMDPDIPMDPITEGGVEAPPEPPAPLTIEELVEAGRECIELNDYESHRLSRFLDASNILKWTAGDMVNAISTCNEDIKHMEERLGYEKSRLEVYEKNLEKIKGGHDDNWSQVSSCFLKVALRLDREAETVSGYGIYLDRNGDITHLVQPDETAETEGLADN